jgi:hypothetical protein
MRCEQVRSLLNDYCEGSLSEAMRERVEAHCAGARRASARRSLCKRFGAG